MELHVGERTLRESGADHAGEVAIAIGISTKIL
jgi:hypothetical protein